MLNEFKNWEWRECIEKSREEGRYFEEHSHLQEARNHCIAIVKNRVTDIKEKANAFILLQEYRVLRLAVYLEVMLMDFRIRQQESVISRLCLLLAKQYWA